MPGGREVGCEGVQTSGSDRLYEGARVRQDGVGGFWVVRDRCLKRLSPATDDVLGGRLSGRPADEFRDFGISQRLNADVRKWRYPGEHLIDTSAHAPEQVAAAILAVLATAEVP